MALSVDSEPSTALDDAEDEERPLLVLEEPGTSNPMFSVNAAVVVSAAEEYLDEIDKVCGFFFSKSFSFCFYFFLLVIIMPNCLYLG